MEVSPEEKEELAIDIKKYLKFEEKRLNNIMQKVEKELALAPEGYLHVARKNNSVHYFHCKEKPQHKEVYISAKDNNLARSLAQKSYNKKVLTYTKKVCSKLKNLLEVYEDGKIEEMYNAEHPDRKNLVVPVELTYEQLLEKWMSDSFEGKAFDDNVLLDSYGMVYPDFTFLSPRTGREIYWEHEGRMDDPGYSASAIKKIQECEKNGIFPGENLILTYETKDMVLDTELVKALAKRYLIK